MFLRLARFAKGSVRVGKREGHQSGFCQVRTECLQASLRFSSDFQLMSLIESSFSFPAMFKNSCVGGEIGSDGTNRKVDNQTCGFPGVCYSEEEDTSRGSSVPGLTSRFIFLFALLIAAMLVPAAPSFASPTIITFDTLTDLDSVTAQFPGITFRNATVLTAGTSLNEFEFPPRSGAHVIFDDGGPIIIQFLNPIASFRGYFTYFTPLTLEAFDSSNSFLGSVDSAFFSNLALSGDTGSSPNEFLALTFGGISSVRITGDPAGGSFVMDDITVEVPEPSSIYLLISGAAGLGAFRRKFTLA